MARAPQLDRVIARRVAIISRDGCYWPNSGFDALSHAFGDGVTLHFRSRKRHAAKGFNGNAWARSLDSPFLDVRSKQREICLARPQLNYPTADNLNVDSRRCGLVCPQITANDIAKMQTASAFSTHAPLRLVLSVLFLSGFRVSRGFSRGSVFKLITVESDRFQSAALPVCR